MPLCIRSVSDFIDDLVHPDNRRWRTCYGEANEQTHEESRHDPILKLIRRKIAAERLVKLNARALNAGVILDEVFKRLRKVNHRPL